MKNAQTSRPGHPTFRTAPVRVSAKATKTAKPVVKARPSKKLHPAEAAGMAVHQAVESGVSTVKDTILTAASYVGNFVKGVVKGH